MPRKKPQAKAKAPRSLQDRVLDAVGAIDRPGTFCTSGDLPLVMPGLEVNGLGAVRLSLGKTQARQLVKLCHIAPDGKGMGNLVYTDVRPVCDLDTERVGDDKL